MSEKLAWGFWTILGPVPSSRRETKFRNRVWCCSLVRRNLSSVASLSTVIRNEQLKDFKVTFSFETKKASCSRGIARFIVLRLKIPLINISFGRLPVRSFVSFQRLRSLQVWKCFVKKQTDRESCEIPQLMVFPRLITLDYEGSQILKIIKTN